MIAQISKAAFYKRYWDDSNSGEISWNHAITGIFNITVTAQNSAGQDQQNYNLTVGTKPTITRRRKKIDSGKAFKRATPSAAMRKSGPKKSSTLPRCKTRGDEIINSPKSWLQP